MTDDTTNSGEGVLELIGRVEGQVRSRREMMGDALKVGAGATALSALGAGTVGANSGSGSGSGSGDDPSDVDILNYALALEHLEYAFYDEFLANHSEWEVESSAVANYFARPTLQYSVYQQIEDVRDHEKAHVDALTETIEQLGGTPVEPADYEFPYDSMEEFVAVADRLESVGVSAYAGAAPMIDSEEVLTAALSIHSVEANHWTYFQLLHLQRPAPNAFNPARTMEQVLPIVKQFIVGASGGSGDDSEGDDGVEGDVVRQFTVQLSGDNEVPPVDTDASGEAGLTLVDTGDSYALRYDLSVMNIEDVTAAHFHLGGSEENGPVVAFLYGPNEDGTSEDGQIASGTITESDLVGPLEGKTVSDLQSMADEGLYVNVHTTANPDGEIRGQVPLE
ncbi:ferritin-like domain-containing protein [Halococcus salsus]|uniref:ferritin-like domain-containing protein n=1 Tax=Halococcus salsus TaxID=2162894 RepID=UPI00135CAA3C|nr:ferritin-like domain-containing protein [Halococcus salsus]